MLITGDADVRHECISLVSFLQQYLGRKSRRGYWRTCSHANWAHYELIHGLMVIYIEKVKPISPRACTKCWLSLSVSAEFLTRLSDCSTFLWSTLLFIHQNNSHSAKNKTDHRTFSGGREKCGDG